MPRQILTMFITLSVCFLMSNNTQAQKPRPTPATTRSLDVEAEKVQMEYLKGLSTLATEYENAGDIQKSAEMLKAILKIKPDTKSVIDKLKEYEEAVFDTNNTVVDVDASRGWINSGVLVAKDKSVRLEAAGTYKFIVNENLGPTGYLSKDPAKDLVSGIPTGALMAMVAPAKKSKNEPVPVMIGEGKEFSPQESGLLFLKFNVPPSAKCIGKVKVKISGNIASGGTR